MSSSDQTDLQQSPPRAAVESASPQKSLNANAKAFQPKLDAPTLQETQLHSVGTNNGTKNVSSARPPIVPYVPTVPGMFPPTPLPTPMPNALLMHGLPRASGFGLPFGVPPSPVFFAPPPSPSVNVGNATLAAMRSKDPPKFACVVLVGLPSSGKTTIGRDLVNGLNLDNLGWSFFSGSDHLKDGDRRPAFWESTKEVFDALSQRLDLLIAKQANPDTRIKGLVIDKNCRGVEDLLYLASLLHSKGLPLVGVVGLEVKDDDELLIRRMGGGEELLEKLKFHRVMQARIVEAARSAGLYRAVDATRPKDTVVHTTRTMVLGCSAQPAQNIRLLSWSAYSDSACPVVENYEEYCAVMTTLFSLMKPTTSAAQWWDHKFPGFTDFVPLSSRELDDPAKVNTLRSNYSVRRKIDGAKHICIFDGHGLYLVPRHMRAVLRMTNDAWLGMPIGQMGRLVLDGDLVRLSKDRSKEKFVVYDALFWSEATTPMSNLVRLASWKERQERLGSSICHEASAFFQKSSNCVVVYQRSEPWERAIDLLEPLDYPSDGLIIQPHHSTQSTYMWRPPQAITCDLRLGSLISSSAPVEPATPPTPEKMVRQGSISFDPVPNVVKIYSLEAYDREQKRYVKLVGEKVEVRRNDVVEGCFCICGLSFDSAGEHHWMFHRARYDVSRAAYKSAVDDLVQNCLIARARLVQWLLAEKLASTSSKEAVAAVQSQQAAQQSTSVSRGAFGSALESTKKPDQPTTNNLEMLQRLVPTAKVQATKPTERQANLQMLESVVGSVNVVRANESKQMTEANESRPKEDVCAECKKTKRSEDLRKDRRDDKFYCYACWAKSGTEFCTECTEFRKGHRETTRRQVGAFYCEGCWDAYHKARELVQTDKGDSKDPKKGRKTSATETAVEAAQGSTSLEAATTDAAADGDAEKKRRRRGGRGKRKKSTNGADEDVESGDDCPKETRKEEENQAPTE